MDDDLNVARALERWLRRRGVEVFLVNQVSEAGLALERHRPTLIICDYLMPNIDGIEVLRQAKEKAPHVRRCLLSGSLHEVTPAQRAAIAPCLFLDKPWDPSQLAVQLGLAERTT